MPSHNLLGGDRRKGNEKVFDRIRSRGGPRRPTRRSAQDGGQFGQLSLRQYGKVDV